MKGSYSNPYLKYLPAALKAAQLVRPYMKTYSQRNQVLGKRRRYGKARTTRRKYRKKKTYSKVARNAKSIKKLQQHDRQSLGDMTYRGLGSFQKISNENAQEAITVDCNRITELETVLAQCKFFDPANPGTLVTGSLATGGYQRNVRFENVTSTLTVANNYGTDCEVTIYLATVKDDTNSSSLTAWNASMVDGSNMTSPTQLGQYPTDFDLVNDLWKLKVAKKCVLGAGQSTSVFHKTGSFEYSSSTVDSHNLAYQKEYKGFEWLVVFRGAIGHDRIVANQTTRMKSGLDLSWKNIYKVKYDAGVNIRYVYVDNLHNGAFTNLGVAGSKPIGENQGFYIG